jgi:hypothetical protein
MDNASCVQWAKNPQYKISLTSKKLTELFISLAQEDGIYNKILKYLGRVIPELKFPYKEVTNQVCFSLFQSPDKDFAKVKKIPKY